MGALYVGDVLRITALQVTPLVVKRIHQSSPALHIRPQIKLKGSCVAGLGVQVPVVFCDVIGVQDAVLFFERVALGEVAANEFGVDGTVDHDVRDMNVLRAEFARHALRERA